MVLMEVCCKRLFECIGIPAVSRNLYRPAALQFGKMTLTPETYTKDSLKLVKNLTAEFAAPKGIIKGAEYEGRLLSHAQYQFSAPSANSSVSGRLKIRLMEGAQDMLPGKDVYNQIKFVVGIRQDDKKNSPVRNLHRGVTNEKMKKTVSDATSVWCLPREPC